jgi:hypothetical protein
MDSPDVLYVEYRIPNNCQGRYPKYPNRMTYLGLASTHLVLKKGRPASLLAVRFTLEFYLVSANGEITSGLSQ